VPALLVLLMALAVLLIRVVLVGSGTWTGAATAVAAGGTGHPTKKWSVGGMEDSRSRGPADTDKLTPDEAGRLFRLQTGLRAATASRVARGRVTR
jgi:hypothetical protein